VSDEKTGRDLVPRPEEPQSAVTPREPEVPQPAPSAVERFSAGEQTHTVGLTEERASQVVKSSGNARMFAFLGVLLVVLFVPIYWLYDIGLPVIGNDGRLAQEQQQQQVTDISRGYALFLANCARCHGEDGQGGIGPILNDQGKLYNALTAQGLPGNGHLNPDYLHAVLQEGGRYVCGDPNSVMPAWLEPKGPLNYRQVQEIIAWITASSDVSFVYAPTNPEGGAEASVPPPVTVNGWRDPSYTPPPGATPVPACWRGTPTYGSTGSTPTAAPVTNPGTADNPRVIQVEGTDQLQWVDPTTGEKISQLAIVPGETVEFQVTVNSDVAHNFHLGSPGDLSSAPEHNQLPGLDTFANSTETFTYTFDTVPEQFACTVPGHYQSMQVDLIAQQAGGTSASPEASPAESGAPPGSAAPAESTAPEASASPAPTAAP
jgi:mono/diheme cytochrome c family protein